MIFAKTFIIAEIGVNHNGSIELAKKLVENAKKCGADAVKFQTFSAETLVTSSAPKAAYQKQRDTASTSQYEMLKKLELSPKEHFEIKSFCDQIGIEFLSSPFDEKSADFLFSLGVKIFKIPSGEITNLPLLRHISKKKRPIIMSTGMSTMKEVSSAVKAIQSEGNNEISLLHCVTEYPAPYEEINLNAMLTMKKKFKLQVGYSDHTVGIEIPVAAVALGAKIIEKHFTVDKNLPGPDHAASAEPAEFAKMVSAIINVEKALGDGIKRPAKCEIKNIPIARKSIVAACEIQKGEIFTIENLAIKRPGTGLPPSYLEKIVGKKAKKDFNKDELIGI